ncbi:MAG TPA: SRPBCC family protein [Pseudonocardia sp.]|jgi:hypothetical protein|nr:SRPBCC family protein [Pseudonocardia sp.]
MAELRRVSLDDFSTAPVILKLEQSIAAPRAQVWELLSGDPARWGRFFPGFDGSGRWLTRTPEGVGSVRRVRVAGVTFQETILAHDAATSRWAFRVDSCGLPLGRAQAEDYSLADAQHGCVLHWTFALWPYVPAAVARVIARPVLRVLARRMAVGLERVTASRS